MRYILAPLALLLLAAPVFAGASPSYPVTSLGSSGANRTSADTTNFGQVVAYNDTAGAPSSPAFLDVGGASAPAKTRSRSFNSAFWLDHEGQLAAYGGSPGSHACLYADSLMIDFEALGGNSSAAYGISDAGHAAGQRTRSGKSGADSDSSGNGGTGEPGMRGGADYFGTGDNLGTGGNFGTGANFGTGISNLALAGAQGDTGNNPSSRSSPFANGGAGAPGTPGANYGAGAGGNNGGQPAGNGGNSGNGNNGGNGGNGGNSASHDFPSDGDLIRDFDVLLHPLSGLPSGGTAGSEGSGHGAGLDCVGQCDASLPIRTDPIVIPEPGSLALFTLALATLAALQWTRKRKAVQLVPAARRLRGSRPRLFRRARS
jgi:hypothetical protein